MKKFTLSVLLTATMVSASDFNYEVTPVAGYLWNKAYNDDTGEMGGIQNHTIFGLEAQFNNLEYAGIKPEVSLLYGEDRITGRAESQIFTGMVNGVYDIDTKTAFTPFVKAGLGYEVEKKTLHSDYNGFLADVGLGTKIDLTKHIALKLEGLYWLKVNHGDSGTSEGAIHNVAALAGLTFSFDEKAAPVVVPAPAPKPVPAPEPKPEPKPVPAPEPKPVVVPVPAICPAPVDSDHDGVFDAQEKCPGTPAGFKVDAEGCPLSATLRLHFATNSSKVVTDGTAEVAAFAKFMKESPAYKARIVGHTDSVGSDKLNQILSEKRAEKVKSMLIENGVAADRLSAIGKGESMPVASNATKEGRSENRRIEVELIK